MLLRRLLAAGGAGLCEVLPTPRSELVAERVVDQTQ